jgi:hypothetical protein
MNIEKDLAPMQRALGQSDVLYRAKPSILFLALIAGSPRGRLCGKDTTDERQLCVTWGHLDLLVSWPMAYGGWPAEGLRYLTGTDWHRCEIHAITKRHRALSGLQQTGRHNNTQTATNCDTHPLTYDSAPSAFPRSNQPFRSPLPACHGR